MSDRFGTTPLPISSTNAAPFEVTYDPASSIASSEQPIQQPLQQELASFTAERADYSLFGASIIAVNSNFIVYAVKNGLIRILSRHSATKSLLRLHQHEIVSDIQFFHDGEFLATVSATKSDVAEEKACSRVIVWRVYHRNAGMGSTDEIVTDAMLEIRSTTKKMVRVVWHPYNPNQFFVIHGVFRVSTEPARVATLVETTKIATTLDPIQNHAVADFKTFSSLQPNGSIVALQCSMSLNDLAWSGVDVNCVMVGSEGGDLIFYELSTAYKPPSILDADVSYIDLQKSELYRVKQESSINRCLFLPHYDAFTTDQKSDNSVIGSANGSPTKHIYTSCFVTGSGNDSNAMITLWSAFTSDSKPKVIQTIHIAPPSTGLRSFVLNTCYGPSSLSTTAPPSCFIIACCREVGSVYAFHVKAQWSHHHDEQHKRVLLLGSDYVVPFTTKHAILSCTITCAPATHTVEDDADESISSINFDMKLFVYQTVAAQCLQLTSHMCLPPTKPYTGTTPGVTAKLSAVTNVVLASALITDDDKIDDGFEDYEIEETEEDEYDAAPDPSLLPIPSVSVISGNNGTNNNSNPFSNWLGALAATTATTTPLTTIESNPITASIPFPTTSENQKTMQKVSVTTPLPSTKQSKPRPQIQQTVPAPLLSPMEILGLVPNDKHQTRANALEDHPTIIPDRENTASAPSVSDGLNNELLVSVFRTIVQDELVPSIRQEMTGMVQPFSELMKPVQSTIDELLKVQQNQNGSISSNESERIATAVTTHLEEGMKRMFTECTRTVLIPTIESVTSQILTKVSEHVDAKKNNDNNKLDLIGRQLATTSAVLAELTKEVNSLREELRKKSAPTEAVDEPIVATAPQQADVNPNDQLRSEILSYIKVRNYEAAFRRAVSNKTIDMALFCCHSVDMNDVFVESPPAISQPILLCLMQQLGTVLDTSPDAQYIVDWLQEITVALYPPVDPQINPHLPAVVQNLVTNLMKRISRTNDDAALRRSLLKLQSLLRGMNLKM